MQSAHQTRQCPFTNCTRKIDPSLFACGGHWRSVPTALRRVVHAAYNDWKRGKIDGDTLRKIQQNVLDDVQYGQLGARHRCEVARAPPDRLALLAEVHDQEDPAVDAHRAAIIAPPDSRTPRARASPADASSRCQPTRISWRRRAREANS